MNSWSAFFPSLFFFFPRLFGFLSPTLSQKDEDDARMITVIAFLVLPFCFFLLSAPFFTLHTYGNSTIFFFPFFFFASLPPLFTTGRKIRDMRIRARSISFPLSLFSSFPVLQIKEYPDSFAFLFPPFPLFSNLPLFVTEGCHTHGYVSELTGSFPLLRNGEEFLFPFFFFTVIPPRF